MACRSEVLLNPAIRFGAVLCAAILASCGSGKHDASAKKDPSPSDLKAKIDQMASAEVLRRGGVGLSVCVAVNGQIVHSKGYGFAEAERKTRVDEATQFRIGSISKQINAVAILRLADQGKVSIDDDFRKYIPEFPEKGKPSTLLHLMTHTSGLKSYTDVAGFEPIDHTRNLSHDEVLASFKDEPLLFEPGTRFQYCNSGSYILGMIVERVSGKSYGDFVRDEITTPMSLTRTLYNEGPDSGEHSARGYRFVNGKLADELGTLWGNAFAGGGMLSTARDLVEWRLALSADKIISPTAYAQMITPFILADGQSTGYGLNCWIDELHGLRRLWHSGHSDAFTAWLAFFPDQRVTVAVLSNSICIEAGAMGSRIAAVALGIRKSPTVELPLTRAERRRFSGSFYLAGGEGAPVISISETSEALFADDGLHPPEQLIYKGYGAFDLPGLESVTLNFPPPTTVESEALAPHLVLKDHKKSSIWIRSRPASLKP